MIPDINTNQLSQWRPVRYSPSEQNTAGLNAAKTAPVQVEKMMFQTGMSERRARRKLGLK